MQDTMNSARQQFHQLTIRFHALYTYYYPSTSSVFNKSVCDIPMQLRLFFTIKCFPGPLLLQNFFRTISHLEFLLCKSTNIVKGHSGYTFFKLHDYAFSAMVTLEGIVLRNNHPDRLRVRPSKEGFWACEQSLE